MLQPQKSDDSRVVSFPATLALDELFRGDTAQRVLAGARSVGEAKAVRDRAEGAARTGTLPLHA